MSRKNSRPIQCVINKAIQKFQNFLYGKEFILETDHQPLLYLGKAQYGQNGHLMRWALVLQQYHIYSQSY